MLKSKRASPNEVGLRHRYNRCLYLSQGSKRASPNEVGLRLLASKSSNLLMSKRASPNEVGLRLYRKSLKNKVSIVRELVQTK